MGTTSRITTLCRTSLFACSMNTKNIITAEGQILRPCSKCQVVKNLDEFYRRGSSRLVSACKLCVSADYSKNLEKSRKRAREASAKCRLPKVSFILEIKTGTPCADCGKNFPAVCMDFDHLNREEKTALVSEMVSSGSYTLAELQTEIKKCEVVCANCHRIRTSKLPPLRKMGGVQSVFKQDFSVSS